MISLRNPIIPSLWFDDNAEEAANWYVSRFDNSQILRTTHYAPGGQMPEGTVLTVDFELDGRLFNAINGGPHVQFSEATSFLIEVTGQEEFDHVWSTLLEDGGDEGPCGWLKDRFGLSWQIAPTEFMHMLTMGTPEGIARAYQAMASMTRLDIAVLQTAYEGGGATAH